MQSIRPKIARCAMCSLRPTGIDLRQFKAHKRWNGRLFTNE